MFRNAANWHVENVISASEQLFLIFWVKCAFVLANVQWRGGIKTHTQTQAQTPLGEWIVSVSSATQQSHSTATATTTTSETMANPSRYLRRSRYESVCKLIVFIAVCTQFAYNTEAQKSTQSQTGLPSIQPPWKWRTHIEQFLAEIFAVPPLPSSLEQRERDRRKPLRATLRRACPPTTSVCHIDTVFARCCASTPKYLG